ncbi:hypothetical protein J2741_001608 [Methanolinea mesophila]|nr:hypothetical protein [Methanolinea mesophila]
MVPPPPKGAPAAVHELVLLTPLTNLCVPTVQAYPVGSPQRRGGSPGSVCSKEFPDKKKNVKISYPSASFTFGCRMNRKAMTIPTSASPTT